MPQDETSQIRFYRIMEDVGINSETKICQYLDLEYLLKILETNTYYVKRKKFFVDKREKNFPLYLSFAIAPVDPIYIKEHADDIARQQEKLNENIRRYQEQSNVLTSCWTVRTMENILMWDRGSKRRARIETTIGEFMGAFESIDFTIWCGKMFYESFSKVMLSQNKIWVKEPYFSDEEEVRFYFSSSSDEVKPDIVTEGTEKGVFLKIDPKRMMRKIVLSPNINRKCANALSKAIKDKYGIEARPSSIEIELTN